MPRSTLALVLLVSASFASATPSSRNSNTNLLNLGGGRGKGKSSSPLTVVANVATGPINRVPSGLGWVGDSRKTVAHVEAIVGGTVTKGSPLGKIVKRHTTSSCRRKKGGRPCSSSSHGKHILNDKNAPLNRALASLNPNGATTSRANSAFTDLSRQLAAVPAGGAGTPGALPALGGLPSLPAVGGLPGLARRSDDADGDDEDWSGDDSAEEEWSGDDNDSADEDGDDLDDGSYKKLLRRSTRHIRSSTATTVPAGAHKTHAPHHAI